MTIQQSSEKRSPNINTSGNVTVTYNTTPTAQPEPKKKWFEKYQTIVAAVIAATVALFVLYAKDRASQQVMTPTNSAVTQTIHGDNATVLDHNSGVMNIGALPQTNDKETDKTTNKSDTKKENHSP